MKKHISILFILSFLILGCSSKEQVKQTTFSGNIMTIDYKIIVGSSLNNTQKENVQQIIQETFNEVNDIYNKWNPNSELSKLNQLKKGTPVKISEKLGDFLKKTDYLVSLTHGLFDPTIEPLQQLWKKHLSQGEEPSQKEIKQTAQAVGWNKIHVQNGYFFKEYDETSIDLGGIAKGFAVDLLAGNLNKAGFSDVFVEWGGEIKASGMHPDNRPWHIFISRLEDANPDNAIAHLDLKNQAIATSGDYLQNWTVKKDNDQESVTYFHVIDSKKGFPLEIKPGSIASVSVVAKDCFVADGIATALMLFQSTKEAEAWGESVKKVYPELQFWIVTRSE